MTITKEMKDKCVWRRENLKGKNDILNLENWSGNKKQTQKMPTKEEKHQSSSGSSNGAGGNATTAVNSTSTTNTNSNSNGNTGSSSSSGEKYLKYCSLCNRNDFTLNTVNVTIEKDLRAILNTEVIKNCSSV